MVRDIDEVMSEYEKKREAERRVFLEKCKSKVTDGELLYYMLVRYVADRFNISTSTYQPIPNAVYDILDYYINEVEDESIIEWLHKNDSPFIRKAKDMRSIFPEFKYLDDDKQIMETANEIYGLDLIYDYEFDAIDYVYSYSFDFNSFEPLDLGEVKGLKDDIRVLQKYGVDTSDLEVKIEGFGLPKEILERL